MEVSGRLMSALPILVCIADQKTAMFVDQKTEMFVDQKTDMFVYKANATHFIHRLSEAEHVRGIFPYHSIPFGHVI
jgi:hypothetical protein